MASSLLSFFASFMNGFKDSMLYLPSFVAFFAIIFTFIDLLNIMHYLNIIYYVPEEPSRLSFHTTPATFHVLESIKKSSENLEEEKDTPALSHSAFLSESCGESARWANYLISDLVNALAGPTILPAIRQFLQEGLDDRLTMLNSSGSALVHSIKITKFEVGQRMPFIKKIITQVLEDEPKTNSGRSALLLIDFGYEGGARFMLTADMGLGLRDIAAQLDLKRILHGRLVIKFGYDRGLITFTLVSLPPFTVSLLYGERRLVRVSSLLQWIVEEVIISKLAVLPGQRVTLVNKDAQEMKALLRPLSNKELQRRVHLTISSSLDIGSNLLITVTLGDQQSKSPILDTHSRWRCSFIIKKESIDQVVNVSATVKENSSKTNIATASPSIPVNSIIKASFKFSDYVLNQPVTLALTDAGSQQIAEIELFIEDWRELNIDQLETLLLGMSPNIQERIKQVIEQEDSTTMSGGLQWSTIKGILDKLRFQSGTSHIHAAALNEQPETLLARHILIPLQQAEHLESIQADWDSFFIPSQFDQSSLNGNDVFMEKLVKKARDLLTELYQEAYGYVNSSTDQSCPFTLHDEGLELKTPVMRAFLPFVIEAINALIEHFDQASELQTVQGVNAENVALVIDLSSSREETDSSVVQKESTEEAIPPTYSLFLFDRRARAFVLDICDRLELMKSDANNIKGTVSEDLKPCRFGVYKVTLDAHSGQLGLIMDRKLLHLVALDYQTSYEPSVDLLLVYRDTHILRRKRSASLMPSFIGYHPDFIFNKLDSCSLNLNTNQVILVQANAGTNEQLDLEFADQSQAVKLYSLLHSRAVQMINMSKVQAVSMVTCDNLEPLAIFLRCGIREYLLTAEDDDQGDNIGLAKFYAYLRSLHTQTSASPMIPGSLRFTSLDATSSNSNLNSPNRGSNSPLSSAPLPNSSSWIRMVPGSTMFTCSYAYKRSIHKGILAITDTHLLFQGKPEGTPVKDSSSASFFHHQRHSSAASAMTFFDSAEETPAINTLTMTSSLTTSGSVNLIIPLSHVLKWRISRRLLITKGILLEVVNGANERKSNCSSTLEEEQFYFFAFKDLPKATELLGKVLKKSEKK